jgi:drug/metabolite transporter (DMT)-like permease
VNPYAVSIGAAVLFGLGTALQHRSARAIPTSSVGPVRLLGRLMRDRTWLLGRVIDTAAVLGQAIALRTASLVAVQSIMACGVLVAVTASAALDRRFPARRTLVGSGIVVLGAVLISRLSLHRSGLDQPSFMRWLLVVAALAATLAVVPVARVARRRRTRRDRAVIAPSVLFGAGAGACFALGSAFLRTSSITLRDHGAHFTTGLALAGFVAMGLVGNVLAQRGFQHGAIGLGISALTATEPVAAFVAGVVLFDERPANGVALLAGGVALALVVLGIVTIGRGEASTAFGAVVPAPIGVA